MRCRSKPSECLRPKTHWPSGRPPRCSRCKSIRLSGFELAVLQITLSCVQTTVLLASLDVGWAIPVIIMAEAAGETRISQVSDCRLSFTAARSTGRSRGRWHPTLRRVSDFKRPVPASNGFGTRRQRVHCSLLRASLLDRVLGDEVDEIRKRQASALLGKEMPPLGDGHLVRHSRAGAEDRTERLPLHRRARLGKLRGGQRNSLILGCRHKHEVL